MLRDVTRTRYNRMKESYGKGYGQKALHKEQVRDEIKGCRM